MVNKSGKNEHPCLVPDLRGNIFSFSPLSMMLAVCLSYMAFIMLRYVPSMPTFWRVFIINLCWILSKGLSTSIEMIIWFLSYHLLMWCYHTDWFLQILKNHYIPGINPTRSWCMSLLMYCWIRIASILLRILHLCSSVLLACYFMEFPGGPVVMTRRFPCCGLGSVPGWGK